MTFLVTERTYANDLEGVLAAIESKDENRRLDGIIALGDFPKNLDVTVPLACKFLGGADDLNRGAAQFAIEKMGPAALEHLRPLLDAENPVTVDGACNAIVVLGPSAASLADRLIELINTDRPGYIFSGLKALQAMGDAALPAIDRVIELLEHPNFNVQIRACQVLRELGGKAAPAIEPLLKLADEGNPSARSTALISLGSIGATVDDERIVAKLIEKLSKFYFQEKERSLEGLAMMGPKAKSAIPEIEKLMSDTSKSIMPEAAYTYWRVGGDVKKVVEVFRKHIDDLSYQDRIVGFIGRMKADGSDLVSDIERLLDADEAHTREEAVMALSNIGPAAKSALPRLKKMAANDEDALVREGAKQAIEAIDLD